MKRVPDKQATSAGNRPSWPDLPPIGTVRWFAGRKSQVVVAVQDGALSVSQVCQRYGLSPEEFREWQRRYESTDRDSTRLEARPPDRTSAAKNRQHAALGQNLR